MEKLEKWLEIAHFNYLIAYTPNPKVETHNSDFAESFLWAEQAYKRKWQLTMRKLLADRYPQKSPVEIYNMAQVHLVDEGYEDEHKPIKPYIISVKSVTRLALGFFILELERNDYYAWGYIIPSRWQLMGNVTMGEIIESYKKMAEDYLAQRGETIRVRKTPATSRKLPDF